MPSREEIREEIGEITAFICRRAEGCSEHDCDNCSYPMQDTTKILKYLHSQGVVIKVDRELPNLPNNISKDIPGASYKIGFQSGQDSLLKDGYEAVESLINDK